MTCVASWRAQTIAEVICYCRGPMSCHIFSMHVPNDMGAMHFLNVFFTLHMRSWDGSLGLFGYVRLLPWHLQALYITYVMHSGDKWTSSTHTIALHCPYRAGIVPPICLGRALPYQAFPSATEIQQDKQQHLQMQDSIQNRDIKTSFESPHTSSKVFRKVFCNTAFHFQGSAWPVSHEYRLST